MRPSHAVDVDALNRAIAEYLATLNDDERDEYETFTTDRNYSKWPLERFVEWLTLSRKERTRITSIDVGVTWAPGEWDVCVYRHNRRNPRMYRVDKAGRDRLEKVLLNEDSYTIGRPRTRRPMADCGFWAHLKKGKDTQ